MRRRDRLIFALANLERGVMPLVYVGANEVLPRLMRVSLRKRCEVIENIPYQYQQGELVHLDVIKPLGEGPFPVVLGVHGGGWVLGRKENIRHSGRHLARHGIMVVLINYRLALNHPWPACADDVVAALRWTKANAATFGGLVNRIGVYGDSAGGHLTALAATKITGADGPDDSLPEIAAAVHWYGVFDMAKFARIPWHRTSQMMRALFGDLAEDRQTLAAASPRHYLDACARMPPTLLFAAYGDPLYSQSKMYARELRARGHDVTLRKYKNAVHGFLNFPLTRECRTSLRQATRFFQTHLGDGASAQLPPEAAGRLPP